MGVTTFDLEIAMGKVSERHYLDIFLSFFFKKMLSLRVFPNRICENDRELRMVAHWFAEEMTRARISTVWDKWPQKNFQLSVKGMSLVQDDGNSWNGRAKHITSLLYSTKHVRSPDWPGNHHLHTADKKREMPRHKITL